MKLAVKSVIIMGLLNLSSLRSRKTSYMVSKEKQ